MKETRLLIVVGKLSYNAITNYNVHAWQNGPGGVPVRFGDAVKGQDVPWNAANTNALLGMCGPHAQRFWSKDDASRNIESISAKLDGVQLEISLLNELAPSNMLNM